jgi:hypothetical protein
MDGLKEGAIVGIKGMQGSHGAAFPRTRRSTSRGQPSASSGQEATAGPEPSRGAPTGAA